MHCDSSWNKPVGTELSRSFHHGTSTAIVERSTTLGKNSSRELLETKTRRDLAPQKNCMLGTSTKSDPDFGTCIVSLDWFNLKDHILLSD